MASKTIVDTVRMQQLRERRRNECCKAVWNVEQVDSGRDDVLIERCTKCGCKHHVGAAQPGQIGATGSAIGRETADGRPR